jgi:hypothetical protein
MLDVRSVKNDNGFIDFDLPMMRLRLALNRDYSPSIARLI